MTRAERHEQVTALKRSGLTFRQIAARLGLAMSTVTAAYYDPTGAQDFTRRRRYGNVCRDCGERTYSNGARIAPERCRSCEVADRRSVANRERRNATLPRKQRWSDEQIFDAIRAVAVDGLVTQAMYLAAYARREAPMPSLALIRNRFDLWATAVDAAGCHAGRSIGPYRTRLTVGHAMRAVEACAADLGRAPTYSEYQQWARSKDAPSAQAVRNRCGRWMEIVRACEAQTGALAA